MSRTYRNTNQGGDRRRRINARAVRRNPPDLHTLAKALLMQAADEAAAAAEKQAATEPTEPDSAPPDADETDGTDS